MVKPTFEDFTESIGIKPPSDFVAVIPSRYPVGIKKNLKMREIVGTSKSAISFFEIAHILVDVKLCYIM